MGDPSDVTDGRFSYRLVQQLSPGVIVLLLLAACAVPVPPTGGPPDSTPPSLEVSEPEAGSVNVDTDRLIFTFSEPVDQASLLNALTITPEISGLMDISGSGRSITVKLPDELRDATTYRVTLDTALKDRRGVALSSPITLAFATGPEIDTAKLGGRMVLATDGTPASGIDVLAYAAADSTSMASGPLYRTQTGMDGRFVLDYLRPDTYFVVGLQDRNRNLVIDVGEWVAVPPIETLKADTVDVPSMEPWILANADRLAPSLDRVRAVSDRELELRMSEALWLSMDRALPEEVGLGLTDSAGTRTIPVSSLWFRQPNPRTLFAEVEGLTPGSWMLSGTLAVADSAGNTAAPFEAMFSAPPGLPAPDESSFLSWTPDSLVSASSSSPTATNPRTVWPQEQVGFRLTRPSSDVAISFVDASQQELTLPILQQDATLYSWDASGAPNPYQVRVQIPGVDSTYSVWLQTATARQLGALGIAVDSDSFDPSALIGRIFSQNGVRALSSATLDNDLMLFDNLPGGIRGSMLVFVDQDGDDAWSPGSLSPYLPAEPVRWHAFLERVRPRWDTIAEDTLRFTLPPPEQASAENDE